MSRKAPTAFPAEVVDAFAREFAGWRLGGCPGVDFYGGFKPRMEKAARKHGRSFADLFTEVHRQAEQIIAAAG